MVQSLYRLNSYPGIWDLHQFDGRIDWNLLANCHLIALPCLSHCCGHDNWQPGHRKWVNRSWQSQSQSWRQGCVIWYARPCMASHYVTIVDTSWFEICWDVSWNSSLPCKSQLNSRGTFGGDSGFIENTNVSAGVHCCGSSTEDTVN